MSPSMNACGFILNNAQVICAHVTPGPVPCSMASLDRVSPRATGPMRSVSILGFGVGGAGGAGTGIAGAGSRMAARTGSGIVSTGME